MAFSSNLTKDRIEIDSLVHGTKDPQAGALALFLGVVRNHHAGRAVSHLIYEAYEPMALRQLQNLVVEAKSRWPLRSLQMTHRLGRLDIGETAVAIAVRSDHRDEAFEACRWAIDEIKNRVPIWKKEFYKDGTDLWIQSCEISKDRPTHLKSL